MIVKLKYLFSTLLILSIFFTVYTYKTRSVITEYPLCSGGYFRAPTGPGIYNLPCIASDRPTLNVHDNDKFHFSIGLFSTLLIINGIIFYKSQKKK